MLDDRCDGCDESEGDGSLVSMPCVWFVRCLLDEEYLILLGLVAAPLKQALLDIGSRCLQQWVCELKHGRSHPPGWRARGFRCASAPNNAW